MIQVIFIRHAESTGNAGVPTHDLSSMVLSDKGEQQARQLASEWTTPPTHIVTSPYVRTKLTAEPMLARFTHVEQEVLPMEEFTYLEPSRWGGTVRVQRLPFIEAYWSTADPVYRDGPGAESFTDLLTRVAATMKRLAQYPSGSQVLAFSHGQFMQALRISLMFPHWSTKNLMQYFWPYNQKQPVLNVECMEMKRDHNSAWRLTSSTDFS